MFQLLDFSFAPQQSKLGWLSWRPAVLSGQSVGDIVGDVLGMFLGSI